MPKTIRLRHSQLDVGSSGATTKRPALLRCLKKLEHGDTLIVRKLDRLGRSIRDLITTLDDLRARSAKFHSLTEAIDTATPTGRAMWQMIEQIHHAPKADRQRRSPPIRGRPSERGPLDALPGYHRLTTPRYLYPTVVPRTALSSWALVIIERNAAQLWHSGDLHSRSL